MVVRIAGKRMYLWRAVDHEGEIVDMLVQRRRDKRAALRLMRKLRKKQGFAPAAKPPSRNKCAVAMCGRSVMILTSQQLTVRTSFVTVTKPHPPFGQPFSPPPGIDWCGVVGSEVRSALPSSCGSLSHPCTD